MQAKHFTARVQDEYGRLLQLLDDCASREIDTALEELGELTEPHVARELSRILPKGAYCLLSLPLPDAWLPILPASCL